MISRRGPQLALLIATLTVCTIAAMLFKPEYISRDGAQYLSIANNLRNGLGNATDVIFYEKHYKTGLVPVPQGTFPPGYPSAIAALSYLGFTLEQSGFVVSLLGFGFIPLLLYGLMRKAGLSPGASAAGSASWLFLGVNLDITLDTISEMPFVALTLASALLFLHGTESTNRRRRWMILVGAGAAAAACFLFRYAGIFFIASLGVIWSLRLIRHPDRDSVLDGIALFLLPTAIIAGSFLRNYLLVGDYFGTERVLTTRPFGLLFKEFYWSSSSITGFSKTGLLAGQIPELLLLVLLPAIVLYLLFNRRHIYLDRPTLVKRVGNYSVLLTLSYITLTSIWLAYLARTSYSDVSARYLVPVVPFVVLFIVALLGTFRARATAAFQIRFLPPLLLIAAVLAGQFNVHRDYSIRRTTNPPNTLIRSSLEENNLMHLFRRLQRGAVPETGPLFSNESQLLYLAMRQPTLGLTPADYSKRIWDENEVFALLCRYRVNFLFFFPTLMKPAAVDRPNYIFFHHLISGPPPAWLNLEYRSPTLRLYTVRTTSCAGDGWAEP